MKDLAIVLYRIHFLMEPGLGPTTLELLDHSTDQQATAVMQ